MQQEITAGANPAGVVIMANFRHHNYDLLHNVWPVSTYRTVFWRRGCPSIRVEIVMTLALLSENPQAYLQREHHCEL